MNDTVTFLPLSITYPQQAEAAVSQHPPGDRRGVQRGDHAADLRAADRGHLPGGWRAAAISNTNTGNHHRQVGMEDTLTVEVEPLCDCGCEVEGNPGFEFTSEHCDYHGQY